jgi:hypothetical protein
MSQASSSTPARKGKKRASRVELSDDSDDGEIAVGLAGSSTRGRNAKKRKQSLPADDSETSEKEEETPVKRMNGKGKAKDKTNRVENEPDDEMSEDSGEDVEIPGGIRPEYQRGEDG